MNRFRLTILGIVGICLFAGVGMAADSDAISALKQTSAAFTKVGKMAMPAIVFINIEAGDTKKKKTKKPGKDDELEEELYEYFFKERGRGMPRPDRQGTGFLISKDGYILTNAHVADGATRVSVKLHDKRVFEAKVVGTDTRSDVALIKIEGDDFPWLKAGDSSQVDIGNWAIAIGNPFGLAETLTVGVISAIGRSGVGITEYENFIQTDAAINPGNSGGPLLNIDGEVIGINTAIFSRTGGFMGVGFTVPINMAMSIKEQLAEHGHIRRGFLGVVIDELTPRRKKSLKLDSSDGIFVVDVQPGSPAAEAGIEEGDVITKINSGTVESVASFRAKVALMPPGTAMQVELFRNGELSVVTASTGVHPDEVDSEPKEEPASSVTRVGAAVGLIVVELDEEKVKALGLEEDDEGVVISEITPESVAERKGLKVDQLIVSVNRKSVSTLEDYHTALKRSEESGVVLLRVRAADHFRFVTLKVPESDSLETDSGDKSLD